jgi:Spy/CpxP family protein refolding chaperone
MGLGLALVAGAAGAAAAQSAQRPNARPDTTQRDHRRWDGERGGRRGGPDAMLLKGITLTDAQKTRIKALREERKAEMQKTREQFGAVMQEARAARERGDTATAHAKMAQVRGQMEKQREHEIATLRTILTAEQQKQLDTNIAAMKERGPRGDHRNKGGQPRSGTGR